MFIWLNENSYPDYQETFHTCFCHKEEYKFAVTGFKNSYKLKEGKKTVKINIFADTKYVLYINKKFIGAGPVCQGGDYGNKQPMPVQYYNSYELELIEDKLDFYVLVQLSPDVQADVSCGRGGLWIESDILYSDGSTQKITTDEEWQCRLETQYESVYDVNFRNEEDNWSNAAVCENIWDLRKSPIKNLVEEKIYPVSISKTDSGEVRVEFDKIYSAYFVIHLKKDAIFDLSISAKEMPNRGSGKYTVKGEGDVFYRSIRLESIGELVIEGVELDDIKDVYLMYSHYPCEVSGEFVCSDEVLNKIYEVGRHTTEICRQTIELDSPLHQENLGCTGDYFISSLISCFCFGDTSLSAFDIIRTAEYLCKNDGKMFHTSYSLIWVMMLYDNYMLSGDKKILIDTQKALSVLLKRFDSYMGEDGVLVDAPNYMFIDWIYIDKYNLHHPPMALGQTVLNAFYYKALCTAQKIYEVLEMKKESLECEEKAKALKINFNKCFFDEEKGLYTGGMNKEYTPSKWLPENTDKRYYLKHANVLAVLYDLCDNGRELMEKVLSDETPVQPYFMHFVLEAIYHVSLFEKYGLKEIYRWKAMVEECDKGMKEAWEIFPGYGFDYSHAWGATPTYQLISKLSGLEIKGAGFKKISLKPNLFGLEFANIKIPTPYGFIECDLGEENRIKVPEGIEIV